MKFLHFRLQFRIHNILWYHGMRQYEHISIHTGQHWSETWFDAFCVSLVVTRYQ
jgi:hypothetical protein